MMHQLFWRVVNATSEFSFKKALEMVVQNAGKGCARWFLDLGEKELWAKHKFDPRICSDENTSNFVESFNSTLGVHRCLPVLSLLEGVRRMTMVRYATRQHVADSWPDEGICPNIMNELKVLKKDSRTCLAYRSGRGEFEVHDGRTTKLHVSLNKRTCACGLWEINGIPCKHAIRAILSAKRDPVDYVSEWYSVRRYKEAYGMSINPIPDSEQWPMFDVPCLEPPTLRRSIGRPSRNRRREPGEQRKGKRSTSIKCAKCQCFGHNSKTCKGGYTAKERAKMQGKIVKRCNKVSGKSHIKLFDSLEDLEGAVLGNTETEIPAEIVNTQTSVATTVHGTSSKGHKRKTR
ncbi:uncharacterized protein LOC141588344 [Silene latifolia]|uniref:uncharacterized protein LOC141588344 n=1 Tax=Silene latifolia TaxID=37657 RepID=UPI003D76C8BD